jgi:hypothetical protein
MNGAQDIVVSAAVAVLPFIGSDGNPVSDVSDFAEVLDYIGSPLLGSRFCSPIFDNVAQRL